MSNDINKDKHSVGELMNMTIDQLADIVNDSKKDPDSEYKESIFNESMATLIPPN